MPNDLGTRRSPELRVAIQASLIETALPPLGGPERRGFFGGDMSDDKNEEKARIWTPEEKKKAIDRLVKSGGVEQKDYVPHDNLLAYLQLKEIQSMLDRAVCEIADQFYPLAGVWTKLEAEAEARKEPELAEIARKVSQAQQVIKAENVKLLQALSMFGGHVEKAFRLVHPETEEMEPSLDSENTNSEGEM